MMKCKNECPVGKFDGCCKFCPEQNCQEACTSDPETCGDSLPDEETGVALIQQQQLTVLQQIADIVTTKKKLEEQEKGLKETLKAAMEKYGVKKFDSDILKITYIAATNPTSIDSAKLKKKYPAIAEECSKTSPKSAYIKVEIKDGETSGD
jgi:hypothetical protein